MSPGYEMKRKSVSSSNIIKKAFFYYFAEVKNAKTYFITILSFILASKISKGIVFEKKLSLDSKGPRDEIKNAFYVVALFETLDAFFYKSYDYMTDVVFAKQITQIAAKAFRTLIYDEYGDFDVKSGKVQYCISTGAKAMSKLMVSISFLILAEILQIAVTFAFTASRVGPAYVVVLTCAILLTLFLHIRVTDIKLKYKRMSNESLIECDRALYEAFLNSDVIKSNCMEEYEIQKYYQTRKKYERIYIGYGRVEDSMEFFQTFLFMLVRVSIFMHFVKFERSSKEFGKEARAIRTVADSISLSVFVTGNLYRKIKEALLNTKLVLEYIGGSKYDGLVEHKLAGFSSKLRFDNVNIYTKNTKILHDLSFEVRKGEKIALVGRNGIGKTTVFKTILGLQKYTGRISVDGVSADHIEISNYRSLFAYIPQNNYLFDDTIYYNVVYGSPGVTMESVKEITNKVRLHNTIMKLKNDYHFVAGERGECLSGGIRQKIILARAFLRNSDIFLFDEPLNNLDRASGEELMDMVFGETFADKTVIMILHNHDLLARFDKVICLDENTCIKTAQI